MPPDSTTPTVTERKRMRPVTPKKKLTRILRFRVEESMYQIILERCKSQNSTPSEIVRESLEIALLPMEEQEDVCNL